MRGTWTLAAGALALAGQALAQDGEAAYRLLPEITQHLGLARRTAAFGQHEAALAHAAVVSPDRRIRVRVDCSSIPRAEQGLYRNALHGAFMMWQSVLGEQPFEAAETGRTDVVIRFRPEVRDKGTAVSGHANWLRGVLRPADNPTVVLSAEVQIRILRPDGTPMNFEQIRACAAHELGHVLGLDDSDRVGDVMGPMDLNRPVIWIRQQEVANLMRARSEAFQIRRRLIGR